MCGINGILRLDSAAPPVDGDVLVRTRDAMARRGPDGHGAWIAADGAVGLGHRRLAIIDLSPTGAQPMAFDGGRFRMVFNGEIFNYRELRAELAAAGQSFVSTSDSEVILALYAREGTAMLARLRGMYTIALWDERKKALLLARDPYGIKPLYYAESGGHLHFASQVRALEASGAVPRDLDPAGLVGFLLWGSVPQPYTLRRRIRALPAGHHLFVRAGRVGEPVPHREITRFEDAPAGALGVADALEDSVRAHLVADVPVAVFLSAGLDSSLVAALARRRTPGSLTTITVRFEDVAGTPRDEGGPAGEVAAALGTQHVVRTLSRADLRDLWTGAAAAMDQPSIDGFNTWVVSRVAHELGFKVVLSGLGGDELFGGYGSFREVPAWNRRASALASIPGAARVWPLLAEPGARSRPKLPGLLRYGRTIPGAYVLRRALFLPEEIAGLVGDDLARAGLAEVDPEERAARVLRSAGWDDAHADPWRAVHLLESSLYMRDQLLRDSDWASMAHSLELRVPLVDITLRDAIAAHGFEPARTGGKAAAVRLAAPEIPAALLTRPKTGFGIPVMEALDEEMGGAREGLLSRRLALRVLGAFGVDMRVPVGR
jgi:asparagine synthase (glutamine-hydrolysing)